MTCTIRIMLATAVVTLGLSGCQTAKVANPLTKELAGNDPEVQLNYWHTLSTRPVTSNDQAFHGLLLFLDGTDGASTYDQRVQSLTQRQMLPKGFNGAADQAVQRGTLAVAACRILQIKGGLMLHLVGNTPRYALRELEFEEIFPPSSTQQTFSGSEFLGIIGRLEDRQRGNPANSPATVMPSELQQGTKPK